MDRHKILYGQNMTSLPKWKMVVVASVILAVMNTVRMLPRMQNFNNNSSVLYDSMSVMPSLIDAAASSSVERKRMRRPIRNRIVTQTQAVPNQSVVLFSSSWNETLRRNETFTGYRYVRDLIWKVPQKVSWSANRDLFRSWSMLPLPPNDTTTTNSTATTAQTDLIIDTLQYAVIRDPLERLYSGYYNKCIKSPDYEDHCTGFSPKQRKAYPPSFLSFLMRNYRMNRFKKMLQNPHYKAITHLIPNLDRMDHVFHMGSPTFNEEMSSFWKRLGANHTEVERQFPTEAQRKLNSYHSGTTSTTIQQHFEDCQTFQLAMIVTRGDYQGKYAQLYFPIPQWAKDKLQHCQEQGVVLPPPPTTMKKNGNRPLSSETKKILLRQQQKLLQQQQRIEEILQQQPQRQPQQQQQNQRRRQKDNVVFERAKQELQERLKQQRTATTKQQAQLDEGRQQQKRNDR
ncbi:sulfotransferase family protein [Nitzschia inconspicua]|uniref:Sulfotransferase family protein n=1 Tax=Nitzschia inconspicua TaxID=303405 RepID=A0A9K3LDD4_9STRA|nr:sulfotransferase family protein [Nitzschia inconspicua]KAG7339504.1 sulfotransferase family protein [Nitzschia inconspicua]KAG7359403.1 sulfotransferase family protein [Nitzschia inconspicua]